jgi:hypothetical protein
MCDPIRTPTRAPAEPVSKPKELAMDLTGLYTDLPASQAISTPIDLDQTKHLSSPRYGRRSASPCRLTLASELGRGLDGAWWPHTTSIARELPDLIDALESSLGQVVDIGINWSPFEGVPDLDLLNRRGVAATPGRESRRLRVMEVAGTTARASLLVVPFRTTTALAVMLLRQAADLPVLYAHQCTTAFQTADAIVRAAREQKAPEPAAADSSG